MGIPIIQPSNTTRFQSITDMIESVSLEQTALSHVLNAEGEKIQKILNLCGDNVVIKENSSLKDFDFIYNGKIAYSGLSEQGHSFVVFELEDSKSPEKVLAYCMDVNTLIQPGEHYNEVILTGSSDLSDTDAKRIRHILWKSFPYVSLSVLKALCGINSLTEKEAVTATQLAIWKLSNNFEMTHSNSNVMQLYQWYLQLEPMGIIFYPGKITLTAEPIPSEDKCGVKFWFKSDHVNFDGTAIPLTYTFSKDIETLYGAIVTEESSGGATIVTVTNLPKEATFSIVVSGIQTLPYGAYRYINAQDLVGLIRQTNTMTSQADYLCKACNFDILKATKSVNRMVNSITILESILTQKLSLFENCLCDNSNNHSLSEDKPDTKISF